MSDSDEEISKEKSAESNHDPDWKVIKSFSFYMLRSFGIALLLLGVVLFAKFVFEDIKHSSDLSGLVTESVKQSAGLIFLSLVGAVAGPFLALAYNSGSVFWEFFGMFFLAFVLLGVGLKFRIRGWGQFLGIAGAFLWLLAGLMSLGQHA